MATVLEGFLVSLGFDIDKDELAKFNTTVAEAGRRFMSIGKAAVGARCRDRRGFCEVCGGSQ